ncbi:hypothetical protein ACGFS9_02995 [Streptomyces sp. NPDC048566]|uniref:hypothetical protein n=1 Tax=Streptomyces sp. NPDC048566 TaxID=3365569 RepID=UPI0037184F4A
MMRLAFGALLGLLAAFPALLALLAAVALHPVVLASVLGVAAWPRIARTVQRWTA